LHGGDRGDLEFRLAAGHEEGSEYFHNPHEFVYYITLGQC
jgi:hypothetical protein